MAIATNYVRHPEAMQFQRELWSKSSRDTILMRIAGLVMRGCVMPEWVRELRANARTLARTVCRACRDWIEEHAARRPPKARAA